MQPASRGQGLPLNTIIIAILVVVVLVVVILIFAGSMGSFAKALHGEAPVTPEACAKIGGSCVPHSFCTSSIGFEVKDSIKGCPSGRVCCAPKNANVKKNGGNGVRNPSQCPQGEC